MPGATDRALATSDSKARGSLTIEGPVRATWTDRPVGPGWRRLVLVAVTAVGLGACTADGDGGAGDVHEPSLSERRDGDASPDEDGGPTEPDAATLEHTLTFEHLGMLGYQRADLEPDGAITVVYGASEPFTVELDDADLAQVRDAVGAARLDEQPSEIHGRDVIDDETIYRFEYGDVRVEAEWSPAPPEVRDLGDLLAELLGDLAREHRSDG